MTVLAKTDIAHFDPIECPAEALGSPLEIRASHPVPADLRWIEVNSATYKLTDGVTERTPASHGQWAGFNIERGLAWVMEVGKPFGKVAWYARCGDRAYGPTKFETTKQAAIAFARGAKSFPESGIASSFSGPVNLHADPEVAAEMRKTALVGGAP